MIVFWHSNVILFHVLQKSDWENFSLAINGPQNDFKRGLEIPNCEVPTLRPNKGKMRFCILSLVEPGYPANSVKLIKRKCGVGHLVERTT